jgi:hypothetical protein
MDIHTVKKWRSDMNEKEIWDCETPIRELLDCEIPAWIEQEMPDISAQTIAAICQGGCASGAYMPACWYDDAQRVMSKHGDDVLDYIEGCCGELPNPFQQYESVSWSGMASFFLSYAVELWASCVMAELEVFEPEGEDA